MGEDQTHSYCGIRSTGLIVVPLTASIAA
jgi:hypothetical protein